MNLTELKQVADDQIHNMACIVKAYGKEEKTQKGNPKQGLLLQSDSSEDWFSFLPQKSERLLGFGDKGKTYAFEIWSNQYGDFCKMAQAQPAAKSKSPPPPQSNNKDRLIVSQVVYKELSAKFADPNEFDLWLFKNTEVFKRHTDLIMQSGANDDIPF